MVSRGFNFRSSYTISPIWLPLSRVSPDSPHLRLSQNNSTQEMKAKTIPENPGTKSLCGTQIQYHLFGAQIQYHLLEFSV